MENELNLTVADVLPTIRLLGIPFNEDKFKVVATSECDGTKMIVVEYKEEIGAVRSDEGRPAEFVAATTAAKERLQAGGVEHEPLDRFFVLEVGLYGKTEAEDTEKVIIGRLAWLEGEDAAELAHIMRAALEGQNPMVALMDSIINEILN